CNPVGRIVPSDANLEGVLQNISSWQGEREISVEVGDNAIRLAVLPHLDSYRSSSSNLGVVELLNFNHLKPAAIENSQMSGAHRDGHCRRNTVEIGTRRVASIRPAHIKKEQSSRVNPSCLTRRVEVLREHLLHLSD